MAEQVAIPAGVNPAAAIPSGSTVVQHSRAAETTQPIAPPVAPAGQQQEGYVTPPPAPAGVPADQAQQFAAFLEWQKSQAAPKQEPAKQDPKLVPPGKPAVIEGIGGDAAFEAAKAAAAHDPYLTTSFELFTTVAPDVDMARAIGTALDRGDSSLIDTRYIKEAGGDKADKLLAIAKGLVQHVNTQVENLSKDIYAKAGGEAQWNAAAEAFNKLAPGYLKSFAQESFDSANPARIKAATEAVLEFAKNSGSVPQPPQGHVRANGGAPNAGDALSKEQFQEERRKLNTRDRDYPAKERQLVARRAMGRQLGL